MMYETDSLFNEAQQLHKLKRLEEAANVYKKVLTQNKGHAEAHHLLGAILVDQGVEATSSAGNKSRANNKSSSVAIIGNHHVDDGLAHLRAAINLKPSCPKYRQSLGIALHRTGRLEEAVDALQHATDKNPNDLASWLLLARIYKKQEKLARAVEAFKAVTRIQPDHPTAHSSAAWLYKELNRRQEAAECFRRHLELHPDDSETQFWLSAMTGGVTQATAAATAAAPPQYVAQLFDAYAETFDSHLVKHLSYKTPWLLMDLLLQCTSGQPQKHQTGQPICQPPWKSATDLGCGTGLMGPLIAEHMQSSGYVLEGVDLSSGMVKKARDRGCYTQLHVAELVEYLQASTQHKKFFDLLVAADVFVYIGNLTPVLAAAAAACSGPGSLLAFSTEATEAMATVVNSTADHEASRQHCDDDDDGRQAGRNDVQKVGRNHRDGEWKDYKEGFVLTTTGRFTHSQEYIKDVLESTGWRILGLQQCVIRYNAAVPVKGFLCVAVKAG